MFMNHILSGYGTVAVAAIRVEGKMSMVVSMFAMGLSMGIMTIIVGSVLTDGCLLGKSSLVSMFIEYEELISLGE